MVTVPLAGAVSVTWAADYAQLEKVEAKARRGRMVM